MSLTHIHRPRRDAMVTRTAEKPPATAHNRTYKGFVAGVFSGLAKLSVGHPFDTIKVRLQTTPASRFAGPWQCLLQTLRHEGVPGLYKGATPPLVGWVLMDSVMLGSLTVYRRLLRDHVFNNNDNNNNHPHPAPPLPAHGHGLAGAMAGATVSLLAAPVEHVKARLQVQYAARPQERRYRGPLDCARRVHAAHGLPGLWRGLSAGLLFRSFFFLWWASYDALARWLARRTALSDRAVAFWAGGLSAQCFWAASYPFDLVRQRIVTDPLGGALGDGTPRFRGRWGPAAAAVYHEGGGSLRGFWRGFLPCFLRAFPANAMAIAAFEGVMRSLS